MSGGEDYYEAVIDRVPCHRHYSTYRMNATQISKVAGIVKKERQKRGERHCGNHKIVQGGNVSLQGAWVSYEDARKLSAELGVSVKFHRLLTLDNGHVAFTPDASSNDR